MRKTAQFRKLLSTGLVVMPGAYNALSALLIEEAGFSAYYISGAGLANAVFGRPDIGETTLAKAAAHARAIDAAVAIPGISDVDTGFTDEVPIAQSIAAFEASGIAGIHIEDQVPQKKCGHLEGKQLVLAEEMAEKIKAACRAKADPDFSIIARTDARAVEGLSGAIDRAKCYAAAGADAIFIEALTSADEFRAFRRAIDIPLLANMTEFGKTPYLSVKDFAQLQYNMVIFPMTLLRVSAFAMQEMLQELKQSGTQQNALQRMQTRDELYKLLKYSP